MKTYLNGEERRIATFIMLMYGIIATLLQKTDNFSKKEVTYLKYVSTYIDKYIGALTDRVGKEENRRIYNEAMNNKIELKPKNCEGQLLVDKHCLEEVCRMAVEPNCFGCTKTGWHNCGLYKCMHKIGMGKVDEDYNGCEYYYEQVYTDTIDAIVRKYKAGLIPICPECGKHYEFESIKKWKSKEEGEEQNENI